MSGASIPCFAGADYVGAGPQLNVIAANDIGAGIGGGAHMQIGFNLGNIGAFHIYPSFQGWWGREEIYLSGFDYIDLDVIELSFNADMRYYFPVPVSLILAPYAGFGFAAIVNINEYEREYGRFRDDTDVGPGFNFFGGIEFPLGVQKIFGEFRGKVGEGYSLMKFIGGLTFTIL